MAFLTFRDAIRTFVPWWAGRESGTTGKVLYAVGAQVDALVDIAAAALKVRYPGLYSMESLPFIGQERRIRRGPEEPEETYAVRLRRWWEDHQRRGGPYALLEQLRAYWLDEFEIDLVYFVGRRFVMEAGEAIARDKISWQFDLEPARWARWWLFYYWPHSIQSDGRWDDPGDWDQPDAVWDSNLTIAEIDNIRLVPTEWNNGHSFGNVVLLSNGRGLWDYPLGDWDDPAEVWESEGPAQLAIG